MRRFLSAVGSPTPGVACLPFGRGVVRLFTANGDFTVPNGVGRLRVHCLGGGGSGGATRFDYAVNRIDHARGGGGGGYAIRELDVTPGERYAITVGAGGSAKSIVTGNSISHGNAGGTSSFGAVVSATGGRGGLASAGSLPSPTFLGGAGVGGDLNFQGGDGGNVLLNATQGAVATGGGAAASIYGDGGSGLSVSSAATSAALMYATGGGGAGAKSPVVAAGNLLSGTAGMGAGATSLSHWGRLAIGPTKELPAPASMAPYALNGAGGNGTDAAGDGGGGAGHASTAAFSSGQATAMAAGIFGGGGGVLISSTTTGQTVLAGGALLGGGGGGAVVFSDASNATSGAGGGGLVIVEY